MFGKEPIALEKIGKDNIDREILRFAIIAELDAINFYEQMATYTEDPDLKTILLDVAREEKTHVGEFQALLLERDEEQVKELDEGKEEVAEELGRD